MQYVSSVTGVASQAESLDPFKMSLVVNIVLYTQFTSQGQFRGASIVINNDQIDTSWVPRTRAAAKVSYTIRQLPSIALKDITYSLHPQDLMSSVRSRVLASTDLVRGFSSQYLLFERHIC
jgi:hypothetical protein